MIKAIIFDLGDTIIHSGTETLIPHTHELLKLLKPKYKLGLITNVPPEISREFVIELLTKTGLKPYFKHIIVSSELGYNKPDPRIFQLMLQKLETKPQETIMIGNTIATDIFGANRIGMKTILLQLEQEYKRSEWETPDHTVHSLKDIEKITK